MAVLCQGKVDTPEQIGIVKSEGKFFGVDPTIIRVVAVLLCIFPPVGTATVALAYILMSFIIPEETDYIDV